MRRTALFLLGATALLAGCSPEQDEAVVGKWTNGPEILVFAKDGTFTALKENKGGKWETYDGRLTLTVDGQKAKCGYDSRSPTYLVMEANRRGDETCTHAGAYWRLDLPAEARQSVVSYSCTTDAGKVGFYTYASPFVVEADETYKMVCFGRTADGCQVVGRGHAHTDTVDMLKVYSTGQAESYGVQRIDGSLRLTLMQADKCEGTACSMNGGYIDLGACTRQGS